MCVCVCASGSIMPNSNELDKKTYESSQRCKDLIKFAFFRKTVSLQSYRIHAEAIRQLSTILFALASTRVYFRHWSRPPAVLVPALQLSLVCHCIAHVRIFITRH